MSDSYLTDFFEIGLFASADGQQVMPDDHSVVEPPLPIPNRTVKRLSADDSEPALVKVGHRQAVMPQTPQTILVLGRLSLFGRICTVDFVCSASCSRTTSTDLILSN